RIQVLREWLVEPGAVVMAAGVAKELGIGRQGRFDLDVGGVSHPAVLIDSIATASAAYDGLVLTDIAQAQEWLGLVGRLSRIDLRVPSGPRARRCWRVCGRDCHRACS